MTAMKNTSEYLHLPNLAVIMKPIMPKDLYHMIFYAAVFITATAVTIPTSTVPVVSDLISVLGNILSACVGVYALWQMHKIIEGA